MTMTTASRFNLSILEHAQKVPGKPRHKTREVKVGNVVIGGSNPVVVQSMTTPWKKRAANWFA
jgi:(E)-4-hydroxy-3-methylbut-2-enyl-diphosphate synthase